MTTFTVFSPAKINLYLRILGRRPDGYHELETVMAPLDFGDQITLHPRPTGLTLECDHPDLPTDARNLALRAAQLLAESAGVTQGAHIVLEKRTPLAAGLGGGSSNAAAVLRGLNQLWRLNTPAATLDDLAARLGSDVNLFLADSVALCHGRGERVQPVPCRSTATVLLINPGFGISTKWAYESWARAAASPGLTPGAPDVTLLLRGLAANELAGVAGNLFNSLEAPSVRKFPVLQLLKQALRADGAEGALMSGSGATVFGLFAQRDQAERSAERIRAEFGPSMWTQTARIAGSS